MTCVRCGMPIHPGDSGWIEERKEDIVLRHNVHSRPTSCLVALEVDKRRRSCRCTMLYKVPDCPVHGCEVRR